MRRAGTGVGRGLKNWAGLSLLAASCLFVSVLCFARFAPTMGLFDIFVVATVCAGGTVLVLPVLIQSRAILHTRAQHRPACGSHFTPGEGRVLYEAMQAGERVTCPRCSGYVSGRENAGVWTFVCGICHRSPAV